MAWATPKKCHKCGKVKMIGDCIVGLPICDSCKNKERKNTNTQNLKDIFKEWLRQGQKVKKQLNGGKNGHKKATRYNLLII